MILGIDIGNKYTTIAHINDGVIDILLNEQSKRRTNIKMLMTFTIHLTQCHSHTTSAFFAVIR